MAPNRNNTQDEDDALPTTSAAAGGATGKGAMLVRRASSAAVHGARTASWPPLMYDSTMSVGARGERACSMLSSSGNQRKEDPTLLPSPRHLPEPLHVCRHTTRPAHLLVRTYLQRQLAHYIAQLAHSLAPPGLETHCSSPGGRCIISHNPTPPHRHYFFCLPLLALSSLPLLPLAAPARRVRCAAPAELCCCPRAAACCCRCAGPRRGRPARSTVVPPRQWPPRPRRTSCPCPSSACPPSCCQGSSRATMRGITWSWAGGPTLAPPTRCWARLAQAPLGPCTPPCHAARPAAPEPFTLSKSCRSTGWDTRGWMWWSGCSARWGS